MDLQGHRHPSYMYAILLFVLLLILLGVLVVKNMAAPTPLQTYTNTTKTTKSSTKVAITQPSSELVIPTTINNEVLASATVRTCVVTKVDASQPSAPAVPTKTDEATTKQYNKDLTAWVTSISKWVDGVPQTVQGCYNDELAKKYSTSSAEYAQFKW